MARHTISKRTKHMRLMRQREAASLSNGEPIVFMEFVPPENMTAPGIAHAVLADFLAALRQEADKAEETAIFLRRTVQQIEQESVPQTRQDMLDRAIGSYEYPDEITVQDLKDIFADTTTRRLTHFGFCACGTRLHEQLPCGAMQKTLRRPDQQWDT